MIVRYSPRATADLQAIHDYLRLRSPKAAVGVLTAIYAGIEFVRRHPGAAAATNIPGVVRRS
jgi:plasmid stabilization system protein ParE